MGAKSIKILESIVNKKEFRILGRTNVIVRLLSGDWKTIMAIVASKLSIGAFSYS